jgi:pimeloyl-ACP methyl ester carboxylesterase
MLAELEPKPDQVTVTVNTTQMKIERLVRSGHYKGPLVLNWVAIGGGADGPNPRNLMEFINRLPQNAVFTVEGLMRNVYPLGAMGIAMGMHVRVGQEDNLWGRKDERATSVQQIERMVRISEELFRPIATGDEAKQIYRIGEFYSSIDETLEKNGWLPNLEPKQRRRTCSRGSMSATVLFVPGLRDHVEDHWQTHAARAFPGSVTVEPLTENRLSRAARVAALDDALQAIEGEVVLAAHSAGCLMVAHWALAPTRPIKAALLATPAMSNAPCRRGTPHPTIFRLTVGCRSRARRWVSRHWWWQAETTHWPVSRGSKIWPIAGEQICWTRAMSGISIRQQAMALGAMGTN